MKIQIVIGGTAYEVEVEVEGEEHLPGVPGHVQPETATIQSTLLPTAPWPGSSSGVDADESKVCRSPLAGVVVRVNVQPGKQVQVDDLMVVLEAMKMETNVTAPIAGKVKTVKVTPGEAVKVSQILIEFE